MPPLPRLRVRAMRDLAEQLRFAPRQALLRHLDRIESLAFEIEPEGLYAEDWLVQRITGYRPGIEEPAQLIGEAVLGDLSVLVERLSASAALEAGDEPEADTPDELASAWGVSRKTIDRYRREGLIARRVLDGSGRARLVIRRETAERFRRAHERTVDRAERYARLDAGARRRLIEIAGRARRRFAWSLNETARRLSARHGPSHEGVRQILRRHDESSDRPIFAERGPMSARERRLAHRAALRGIDVSPIAARFNRSAPTVRRGINLERLDRLATVDLGGPMAPWFEREGGASRALDEPPARDVREPVGERDLLAFIRAARAGGAPIGAEERARAAAHAFLRWRARTTIVRINRTTPQAELLDRIETDLRWAARLKAELMRSQLPLLVRTLEARVGRELERVRAPVLIELVQAALAALGRAADEFDPFAGGRLAGRAGLAIDRAAQQTQRSHRDELERAAGRASPRLTEGIAIADWTRRVAPWQGWLELPDRARPVLDELEPDAAALLRARYGIGEVPLSGPELRARFGISRVGLSRAERRALRGALERARAGASSA